MSRSALMPQPPQRLHALGMLMLATLCWGLSFPLIKAAALGLPASGGSGFVTAMLLAPRFVVAAALLLLWQNRALMRTTRRELRQGLELAVFSAGGMLLQNDGLRFTEASTSAFLTQLYAILIPVWLAFRQRRSPGLVVWLCTALVLAGVAILGHFDWHRLTLGRGELETLAGSVFFMGQILCLARPRFAGNDPLRVAFVMFAAQALLYSALLIPTAPSLAAVAVPFASPVWLAISIILGVVCTAGACTLMNVWQPKISATEAGLIYCFEPIFASLFALALPAVLSRWCGIDYANETVTWSLLGGGALITLANALLHLRPTAKT